MPKVDDASEERKQYADTVAYLKNEGLCLLESISMDECGGLPALCWRYYPLTRKASGDPRWGNLQRLQFTPGSVKPWFPVDGYYNLHGSVIFFGRNGRRQWKKSFSASGGGVTAYRLPCPYMNAQASSVQADLSNPYTVTALHDPLYPKPGSLTTIEEDLLSGKIYQIALCKHVAIGNIFYKQPPIVFYRGVVAGHLEGGKIHLTPHTSFFKEDIEQYAEVVLC